MQNKDCIFCKIVLGEIPCAKVWEDKKHLAILDLFPNTKGMTLVIPKDHYNSYVFDMPDKAYSNLMLASKKVSELLDKKLKVLRTAMVAEGMGVDHVHIKLYPMHGLDKKYSEMIYVERRFFDKYDGHISTVMGPEADKAELNKLDRQIRGK
jgi:histidine triad (HIT) family protein